MAKFRVTIMVIILLGAFTFGFYMIWASGLNYDNKGKKALISGKDSCTIISEEKDFFMRAHPKRITVLYKDSYGKYVEQSFQADMITIIK